MSINFEGNIESGRLKFDANFSENKGIKDKGIKVNKGITKFAKNAFAAIGLGGGTIKIFGPDNKALHINKQSAIKWIKAHGEKADTENVDKLSSKAVGEKVAYLYVQKKAGEGSRSALLELGHMYETGTGVKQSYEKAVQSYRDASREGDLTGSIAHLKLGDLIEKGLGTEINKADAGYHFGKAFKGIEREAKQGNLQCQVFLADMYEEGKGIPKSKEEAANLYQKAADKGDAYAQGALALKYLNGSGVDESQDKALELARKSAKNGHPYGQFVLGLINEKNQKPKIAEKLIKKAATQGFAPAQQKLASIYADNDLLPDALAFGWFKKAADQGLAESQYKLGEMYSNGMLKSPKKAAEWYEKAAKQNHLVAQYSLGKMYLMGQGVDESFQKAIGWLNKAGSQGFGSAQAELATISHQLESDANKGDLAAQLKLAGMFLQIGENEKAVKWFEIAANNSPEAQLQLGQLYRAGRGVVKSDEKAAEWFLKAAENDNAEAQYRLGAMYFEGKDTEQTLEAAVKWLERSEKLGNSSAARFLRNQKQIDGNELNHYKELFLYQIGSAVEDLSTVSFVNLNQIFTDELERRQGSGEPLRTLLSARDNLTNNLRKLLNDNSELKALLEKADERLAFAQS
ncbi:MULTISPECIES: tetratricopeptide repeat protein [Parachlamydia]|jgi:TPR repeat protein|uniref:tetratricopeptide repeat protein n=1 Tax=Parachlamydia TaxID=83551 RepID=UPI00075086AA|nr:tetratricopeptide repeat protein [Parachlamydia acanthamoebae]